jgi:hypothetical protein
LAKNLTGNSITRIRESKIENREGRWGIREGDFDDFDVLAAELWFSS